MALSKPITDLTKTSGAGGSSGGTLGGSSDNRQIIYVAAAAVAAVATVTAGYVLYTKYRSPTSDKKGSSDPEPDEKIKKDAPYQALKELGNQKFKSGDYGEALENYTKAIDLLDSDTEVSGEAKAQTLSMLFQNRAAVFEKTVSTCLTLTILTLHFFIVLLYNFFIVSQ